MTVQPIRPATHPAQVSARREAARDAQRAVVALWGVLDGLDDDDARQVLHQLRPWLPGVDVDRVLCDLTRDRARRAGGGG